MGEKLPRNKRAVGTPEEKLQVFVEDYVFTYLKGEFGSRGAILTGHYETVEDEIHIYVAGAIECPILNWHRLPLEINTKTWNYVYQELRRSFAKQEIVGWYMPVDEEAPENYLEQIFQFHKKDFSREDMIFLGQKKMEQEMFVVGTKEDKLSILEGYYIYYEKNDPMREYMMLKREEWQLERDLRREQRSEDRVVMRYRDYMNSQKKQELRRVSQRVEKANAGLAYGVCVVALLFLFVLSMGIVAGYQEVNEMDEAMSQLGEQLHIEEMLDEEKEDTTEDEEEQTGDGYYVVQQGDSLESISEKIYHTADMVEEICQKNQITDPEAIYVGQKILLP